MSDFASKSKFPKFWRYLADPSLPPLIYLQTGPLSAGSWNRTAQAWTESENAIPRILGMEDCGCEEITREEAFRVIEGEGGDPLSGFPAHLV